MAIWSVFDKPLALKNNVTITTLEMQLYTANIKSFIVCKFWQRTDFDRDLTEILIWQRTD